MDDKEMNKALGSWASINKALTTMIEGDCKAAINKELMGKRRKDIALRIHQRYCSLRAIRERAELLQVLDDTPKFLTPTFEGN